MKTIIPMQRVGELACAAVDRPRRGVARWALAGFGVGVVAVSAYLLLGGQHVWNVPRWAAFVFYPGLAAGVQANQLGLSVYASSVVGVISVGLS